MRIPTLGALTLAAAAAVVAVPTAANAAAPTANNDTAQASFETAKAINVLTNDTSDPGTTKTVTTLTPAAGHGTVSCTAAGTCTYTPATNWRGSDSFNYTFSDGAGGTASGTVTVETGITAITLGSTPANLVAKDDPDNAALRNPSHKVTGTVTGAGGVPVQGLQVQLYSRPNTSLGTAKVAVGAPVFSDANGKISVGGLRPIQKTYYSWRSVAGKLSVEKSVTVTPFVTAKVDDNAFAKGGSVTVTGVTGPVTTGQDVVLQEKLATGWSEVETLQVAEVAADNSAGFDFATITHDTSGAFLYRVIVPEVGGQRLLGKSGQKTVNVYNARISNVETNLKGDEFVTVENNGKVPFNLKDWQLSGSGTTVTLPKRLVGSKGFVRIHTGKGFNDAKDLYLGKAKTVSLWPRTGTVTLKDNATPKVQMGAPFAFS